MGKMEKPKKNKIDLEKIDVKKLKDIDLEKIDIKELLTKLIEKSKALRKEQQELEKRLDEIRNETEEIRNVIESIKEFNKNKKDQENEGEEKNDARRIVEQVKGEYDSSKEENKAKDSKEENLSPLQKLAREKEIVERRKIGYIKQIIDKYVDVKLLEKKAAAERNKSIFKKGLSWVLRQLSGTKKYEQYHEDIVRAKEIIKKDVREMTEEEKKFLKSIDLEKIVKESDIGEKEGESVEERREKFVFTREKIRLMENRLMKLEGKIFKEENKDSSFLTKGLKSFGLAWKKFKIWYENPRNKRELKKRAKFTGLVALIAGIASPLALGTILKGYGARFLGAYAGGEGFRFVYDKTLGKDYRIKLSKLRNEYKKKINWVNESVKDEEEKKERIKEINTWYQNELNAIDKDFSKYIKRQEKGRKWADRIGRILGAFATRYLQDQLEKVVEHGHEKVESASDGLKKLKPEKMKTAWEGDHPSTKPEVPEVVKIKLKEIVKVPYHSGEDHIDPSLIPEDSKIHPGDGVTQIIKRQFEQNPKLAKFFGIEHGTAKEYADFARKFGYKSGSGEVLLKLRPHHSYIPTLDSEGNPVVLEVNNQTGKIFEVHTWSENTGLRIDNLDSTFVDSKVTGISYEPENPHTIEDYEYFGDWHKHASHAVKEGDVHIEPTKSDDIIIEKVRDIDEKDIGETVIDKNGLQVKKIEPKPQLKPEFVHEIHEVHRKGEGWRKFWRGAWKGVRGVARVTGDFVGGVFRGMTYGPYYGAYRGLPASAYEMPPGVHDYGTHIQTIRNGTGSGGGFVRTLLGVGGEHEQNH